MRLSALILCFISWCLTSSAADWEVANGGISGYSVADVVIDPSNPSVMYCSCKNGVYKTTNGGASWVQRSSGLPSPAYAGQLAVDPSNTSRVYVRAVDSNGAVIWRSDNGGTSWTRKGSGINHPDIASVAVSASSPNIVYCGTIIGGREGGCYASSNYGDTWTQVSGSDIAGSGLGNDCSPLVVDPTDPGKLYGGKTNYTDFFRSTDGGFHWTTTDTSYKVRGIGVHPTQTARVIACGSGRLRLSVNSGESFVTKLIGREFEQVEFVPSDPSVVYATCSSGGIYRSDDAGDNWYLVSGSDVLGYTAMSLHPTDPNTLVCVVPGRGVAKSADGGSTFTFINTGLPSDKYVWKIKNQPGSTATYAGANYVGFYRSFDEGASWQFTAPVAAQIRDFAFSRQEPSTMYYVGYPSDQVMKSTDGGFNWEPTASKPGIDTSYTVVGVDPNDGNRVFAAGSDNKLYRSTDGGATWETVHTITWMPDWWSTSYWGITFDPVTPGRIYLATYSWPWRSDDGGTTWTKLSNLTYIVPYGSPNTVMKNTSFIRDITVDPVSPNVIYASTQWGGAWKSTDYGSTWAMIHNKVLDTVNNLIIDSRDHNTLYLSSYGYSGSYLGVWKSTTAGATWATMNSGLTGNDLYPNWINQSAANPDRLYVAGQVNGVYRTPGAGWGLSMRSARALPDGGYCLLADNPIVSLKHADGSGCIQNPDRLWGIRATNLGAFVPGDRISVTGTIRSEDGDCWMLVDHATLVDHPGTLTALSASAKSLNSSPSPVGILSRAWGVVTEADPLGGWYYVDDGSGCIDGSGRAGLKIRCDGSPILQEGTFAVLEGVLGVSGNVPCLTVHGTTGIISGERSQ